MNTETVVSVVGANAYLAYVAPGKGKAPSVARSFLFWLEVIEQGHEMSGSMAQSQLFQHFYARSYVGGPISLTGRVKTQEQYNLLGEFIRTHQLTMVSASGGSNVGNDTVLPLMRLGIPSENLYYTGWINAFEAGVKHFNVAPQFITSFQVAADKHSTNELTIPSYLKRATFTGAFLDGPVYVPPTSTPASNPLDNVTSVLPQGQPGTN